MTVQPPCDTRGCPFHARLSFPGSTADEDAYYYDEIDEARLAVSLDSALGRCTDAALAHHRATVERCVFISPRWGSLDADSALVARYRRRLRRGMVLEQVCAEAAERSLGSQADINEALAERLLDGDYQEIQGTLPGAGGEQRHYARIALPSERCFVALEDGQGHPACFELNHTELGCVEVGVHGLFVTRLSKTCLLVNPIISVEADREHPESVRRPYPRIVYGEGAPAPEVRSACERYIDCRTADAYQYLDEDVYDVSRFGFMLDAAGFIVEDLMAALDHRFGHGAPSRRASTAGQQTKRNRRR